MNNMQDYLFRDLLADLISRAFLVLILQALDPYQSRNFCGSMQENPAPEYDSTSVLHSRLLMYDFLI